MDTGEVMSGPASPPATCPIGWQPTALRPVLFGARSLGPKDGAPVPLRIFFPSLDGAVESAAILSGCGRYPLIVFLHGHCHGDTEHYRRWFRIPAQLARAGNVVVVPHLAGVAGGQNPSVTGQPDEETLGTVVTWVRSAWTHHSELLPPPATGIIGHGFGAMLGARFVHRHQVSAYAGLSGEWQDWFGAEPFPLPLLDLPTLLVRGGAADQFSQVPDATWQAMATPRHRVVFDEGEHWDYLGGSTSVPCRPAPGPCPHVASATADLLTMFFGRYLPPELATDHANGIPASLDPPALALTAEQEFFAGGYLGGFEALAGHGSCGVAVDSAVDRLVADVRSRETHSVDRPCPWVAKISMTDLWVVSARPAGYRWCGACFPSRADG